MNTSALKAFAPVVRKQLIEAVTRKLDQALTSRAPDYLDTYATQVRALQELAAEDREGLIERVAYTWFNRFAALRYLDTKGWHPFHARVLTAAGPDETLPELLKTMRSGALPDELQRYTDVARLDSLLIGRIPSADPQAEVYRHLVLAACRFYHGLLPDVFERLDDETELLLPDDLLTAQSVAEGFRTEITDDDCEQVEVLGWLYQFYISEKKDQVMARKGVVPSADVPARTQLFTPHWIVRYLVENSLGRLWLLNRPASLLKAWMPYYIESAEPETEFPRIERPQDIRLCDPAAGSGHMLTYAFDLLYVIYEEEGYAPSEIPALILRHNLTGIEIDARAAQLAALALTLKGREKAPRFFQQQYFVRPNIVELRDIHFDGGELQGYSEALGLGGLFTPPILELMNQFEEAKSFGSLIQPCVGGADIAFARGSVEARGLGSNLFLNETHKKVLRVLEQAGVLYQQYNIVVTNPPYMGGGNMNDRLKQFASAHYSNSKSDLFAMFIHRAFSLTARDGFIAMVTMQTWMFLSSFELLRKEMLSAGSIVTLAQIGYNSFPEMNSKIALACSFVLIASPSVRSGAYVNLNDAPQSADKEIVYLNKLQRKDIHRASADEFRAIPGSPIAYWISERVALTLGGETLRKHGDTKRGLQPGNVPRFVRSWWEGEIERTELLATSRESALQSSKRWFKFDSGGLFRKWYGNNNSVVDWENDGHRIRQGPNPIIPSEHLYFQPAIAWSKVSSGLPSFRHHDGGVINGDASPCFFPVHFSDKWLALLNSNSTSYFLSILSPTLNLQVSDILRIPAYDGGGEASAIAAEAVTIARSDWNGSETSWDFQLHPLVNLRRAGETLHGVWEKWKEQVEAAIARMRELETKNNRLFIEAYQLQGELTPDVPANLITLARADVRHDMAALLSYAIGCEMGRYSLDHPGLILADAGDGLTEYGAKVGRATKDLTFMPDRDGIIPVLDDEWFPDDVVARTREFLKVTFGEAALRENIRFIEESLGRDLRSYFLTDFYKDHLQTYKKRPIYWMVQSPRKGFSVLIYLHRYTRDTMNLILNRYLREFQVKLRSKIDHLQQVGTSTSASNREKTLAAKELTKLTKTLHECEEWERQTILPLAQARIELDLDDGVKVNYLKLGEALAPIPGLAAAEE